MEKKFGDYTYFEVAKECEKHRICTHCPFFTACYYADAAVETPALKKDRGIYNEVVTVEE